MAVGLDVAKKTLEDMEKNVTCAVCHELYTDPKILPCLHYCCKKCVLSLALKAGKDKPFSCPECPKDTTLSEGGVEEFKSAFIIDDFKATYTWYKKALSKQLQCEMCSEECLAEVFCKQCLQFACKECECMHSVMAAAFAGHEVISIDQLQNSFCFDCNNVSCRDDTIKDHKDHDIEFNNVAAENKKKDLVERLKTVREVEASLSLSLEQVCTVIAMDNMPTTAEVNQEIKIEVVNTNKKVIKSRLHLQCQVKCLPTGAVSKPDIKVKTPDRYQISYTPSVRGRHELSISAYGQSVPGSPFTTTVYMSPTQLDKPVKVWGGVTKPYSIAVNSVGEIIVAEYNKDIVVLDNEGKILRRIEQSQHKISSLRSVAVDNEDNIYYIGYGSNKIGKANKNCDILLVCDIQVKQRDRGYWDIAVVGYEVMVTEWYNDGYIMVYDRELNYVRQITSRNKTTLRCLYPDHHGNLYISDFDNTVQVLSKTGDFIRSFSRDHNGVQQLMIPVMVHVCGQYVYVADLTLRKTVVFTTEGDYVTTFGCYGGICVSQDGVMYSSNYINSKLYCY